MHKIVAHLELLGIGRESRVDRSAVPAALHREAHIVMEDRAADRRRKLNAHPRAAINDVVGDLCARIDDAAIRGLQAKADRSALPTIGHIVDEIIEHDLIRPSPQRHAVPRAVPRAEGDPTILEGITRAREDDAGIVRMRIAWIASPPTWSAHLIHQHGV